MIFLKMYVRLKNELSVRENVNDSPFRVSLSALRKFGVSGSRWWLKADTCSGPMALEMLNNGDGSRKEKQPMGNSDAVIKDEKLLQMAKKLRFNTDVKKLIFSVLISSSDVDEAIEVISFIFMIN